MEIEVSAEAKDKTLNSRVAVTVVLLSVFMGVSGIKDGNLVQNMQAAQAQSIDLWNEYQATKTKEHIAEASRTELALLGEQSRPSRGARKARCRYREVQGGGARPREKGAGGDRSICRAQRA